MKRILLILIILILCFSIYAEDDPLAKYNVIWDSPSADFNGSMPIGNGDIGANVWVEDGGDLLFYIPLTKEMEGKEIEIIVLGMKGGETKFIPTAYLTCYPKPYKKKELKLYS